MPWAVGGVGRRWTQGKPFELLRSAMTAESEGRRKDPGRFSRSRNVNRPKGFGEYEAHEAGDRFIV
jgi:hypothetical protein